MLLLAEGSELRQVPTNCSSASQPVAAGSEPAPRILPLLAAKGRWWWQMCLEEMPSSILWFKSTCDCWLQGRSSGILCLTLLSVGYVSPRPLTSTTSLGKLIQQP